MPNAGRMDRGLLRVVVAVLASAFKVERFPARAMRMPRSDSKSWSCGVRRKASDHLTTTIAGFLVPDVLMFPYLEVITSSGRKR